MATYTGQYFRATWRRSLGAISQRSFACSSGRRQLEKRHRKLWWSGSNTALVARLQRVELSQGEFGSGPARCAKDATQGSKYERRAASSNDSTTAPLRPGNSCKAAHNPSGLRWREAKSNESGRQSRFAVLVEARRGRWPDAETGRNGSIARAAGAARGLLGVFLTRHGQ